MQSFRFLLFLLLAGCGIALHAQTLRVTHASGCSFHIFAVIEFANNTRDDITSPLAPDFDTGRILQSASIEYFDAGTKSWHFLMRGSDMHPAGSRRLEPGESMQSLVWASDTLLASHPSENVRLRAKASYSTRKQKNIEVYSAEFTLAEFTKQATPEAWRKKISTQCEEIHDY
jgi:hypothetical protein